MVNIRDRRLSLDMTQEELGRHVGVSKMTISRWEAGLFRPRADRAVRLAAALNCGIEDLPLDLPSMSNSA